MKSGDTLTKKNFGRKCQSGKKILMNGHSPEETEKSVDILRQEVSHLESQITQSLDFLAEMAGLLQETIHQLEHIDKRVREVERRTSGFGLIGAIPRETWTVDSLDSVLDTQIVDKPVENDGDNS